MSRPAGLPKTGGRKKGTLNKKTVFLRDVLESKNINLLDEVLAILPELDARKRVDILIKLMEYVYTKPKYTEVDLSSDIEDPHSALMVLIKERTSIQAK